uniref:Uncharacterized protein n=1 Tax=Vitis vinifera TaxID=29760 RepID=A5C9F7_VITVI|nr:hypothetical protein VITISV_001613 [Vitis vinifera]
MVPVWLALGACLARPRCARGARLARPRCARGARLARPRCARGARLARPRCASDSFVILTLSFKDSNHQPSRLPLLSTQALMGARPTHETYFSPSRFQVLSVYHPSAAQPIAKNDPNPLRAGRKESKPEPMGSTKLKTRVTKALGQPHCDGSRCGRRRWTATTTPRQAHQEEGSQEQSSLRFIQREGPQRKLERELVQYGGAPTATGSEPDECDDEHEQHDGVDEPIASVSETVVEPIKAQGVGGHMPSLNTSLGFHTLVFTHQYLPWTFLMKGTTMYDNGDTKVIVTTSEISREEENHLTEKTQGAAPPAIVGSKKKHNVPVSKKKAFKRVVRHRSQPKLQRKRDKKKGGKKNKKIH